MDAIHFLPIDLHFNLITSTSKSMSNSGGYNDLDPILLQAEQNFFEKSEEEIMRIEQNRITQERANEHAARADALEKARANEHAARANALEKEQKNTIRLLRLQLLQAQEEIGLSNHRLIQSLQQAKDFKLQAKQLNQAQEELSVALDNARSLQSWQQIHRTSITSQLKLLIKTLAHKLRNKAVWLIPLQGARKGKAFLKRFSPSKS